MTRCLIAEAAERAPQGVAVISESGKVDYGDLDRLTTQIAYNLNGRGVRCGEPVAILAENRFEYIPLLFALARLGAVACPMSTRLPRELLSRQIDNIGCRTVIVSEAFAQSVWPDHVVVIPMFETWNDSGMHEVSMPGATEPATIIHTSGSSSTPKAVRHRWASHIASAAGSNENIPLAEGDCWLLSLPLYHVGGLAILFRCFLAGAAVAVPSQKEPLHESLTRFKATHLSVVPTQLRRLVADSNGKSRSQLKAVLVGGAEVPPGLIRRAFDMGLPLYTSYGSTEMASQIATTRPNADLEELMTSGFVLAGRGLSVADDGELLVRGDTLCEGFVVGGKVESALSSSGWYASGDVGRLDSKGRLIVLGREDRMFVSGGENIHPEQIERVLLETVGIIEAVVFPVADDEYGYRPVAVVVYEGEGEISKAGLVTQLEQVLERFKIPDRFYLLETEAGQDGMKPDRQSIETRFRSGEAREIT